MEITHVLYGTVTVEPGTSASHVLDIPVDFPSALPNLYLSRVVPSDPAELGSFKLIGFAGGSPSSRDNFVGVRQFVMIYTLTGVDPVAVDLSLLFTMGVAPITAAYGGV